MSSGGGPAPGAELPDRGKIETAAARIRPHVRVTPVIDVGGESFGSGADLALKLELTQHTGSFKPRGAFNRILSAVVPESGVITASGGNHGQAVAFAARRLAIRAEIFVPASSPPLKAERIRRFGADVRIVDGYYDDAMDACRARAVETGALLVHPYDHPDVVAGQGSLGRELDSQAPDLDTVLVAVGGGGLAAGLACWYRTTVRIITVEPRACPTMARALEVGAPTPVEVGGIAADSLGAREIGRLAFEAGSRWVDEAVVVDDEVIMEARRRLWDEVRILSEPGGAAALAALIGGRYRPQRGERVGVIVCGGNTDELP